MYRYSRGRTGGGGGGSYRPFIMSSSGRSEENRTGREQMYKIIASLVTIDDIDGRSSTWG